MFTFKCSNSMASQAKQKHPETMEEVLNSINHACDLAKKIESELTTMANHPDILSSSIDDVVKAFIGAKEKLMMMNMMMMVPQQDEAMAAASSFPPMLTHDATTMQQAQTDSASSSVQEWLRSASYAHTMDQFLLQMQQQQPFDVRALMGGVDIQQLRHKGTLQIGEIAGRDVEGSEKSKGSEGEAQGIEASPSRPRKRKNDAEKRTMLFPVPQVGNTEMPQEDGFTWRKYGQKEILGSKYPRGYYRCTHQKQYGCPAKKQVQRLDNNPNIFEVTYRGEHSCHMSSTAPSSFPPPPPQLLVDIPKDMAQATSSSQISPSSTPVSRWAQSVSLSLGGGGAIPSAGGSDGGGGGRGSGGASTSKFGADNYLVAEMADAMFNSGSSSGNCSMESLFPTAEDKWEPAEKKS